MNIPNYHKTQTTKKVIAAINMTLDGFCEKIVLKQLKTKTFGGGTVILYYEPMKEISSKP